ncbi:tRNA lysidine(34) synthetase TilS [Holosporaceae bacterium 'Namur']|nr:tRNA lysidine(34) synthetase TilS [Holosporaceae bacterium 'Namur']
MVIDFSIFEAEIRSLLEHKQVDRIAIAVSGGADSMCLTYLCRKWGKTTNTEIICLIVDHKFRQESTIEAESVRKRLLEKKLKAEILTFHTEKPKANLHAIAREERYNLLTDFCKKNNIKYLLTAHNRNDQAETVLMRIFRGTGIDGLTGIPGHYETKGISILRPLLLFSREEIEATLTYAKWEWVNDPSNLNEKYERSKIRKLINTLPEKQLIISRLNLLAKNSARAKSFLNIHSNKVYEEISYEGKFGEIYLNKAEFLKLDEEIALRILTRILNRVSGNHYPPRLGSLELLYNLIRENKDFIKTLWGCEINANAETMLFYRELNAVENMKKLIPHQETIWDNRYKIKVTEELSVGALNQQGLKTLKAWIKDRPISKITNGDKTEEGKAEDHNKFSEKLPAKLLYTTPGLFKDGKLVFYPILNIGLQEYKIDFSRKS